MDIKITSIAGFGFNTNALSVHGVLNKKPFEVLVQLPDTSESKHELVKGDINEAELNMIVNEAEDMLSPFVLFDDFNYKNVVLIKDEALSSYFNKTIYALSIQDLER